MPTRRGKDAKFNPITQHSSTAKRLHKGQPVGRDMGLSPNNSVRGVRVLGYGNTVDREKGFSPPTKFADPVTQPTKRLSMAPFSIFATIMRKWRRAGDEVFKHERYNPTMLPHDSLSLLDQLGCRYAFYYSTPGTQPVFQANHERFHSASLIKVPILLAWIYLERAGDVSRAEICDLDQEPQVQGAGFSWMLRNRHLPYQDVLLMMMALSDNLCTNLVIRRVGLERLNQVIHAALNLPGMDLQRKLFDNEARARGLDNWVSARDCIALYERIAALTTEERAWVESMMGVCQDDALLMRRISRDTVTFYHKTGSITGVLHDWGYTDRCQIFLLTENVPAEPPAFEVFGKLGELLA
jgi:beta-lactamase class A